MGWLGKWRSNPATGNKPWNISVKGFLNNCDDILKWEPESVQWIDTQELNTCALASLSFILVQSSTNPETAETSISRFVLRITHTASLYLQIVVQPWGEVSLSAQNFFCHVQQTETELLLCHWQRCVLASREPPNQWLACLFQRQFPQCCNFFHCFYFLEHSFANLGAFLCHFCSMEKDSMPHSRFLRHGKVLVPVRTTFSHFPE